MVKSLYIKRTGVNMSDETIQKLKIIKEMTEIKEVKLIADIMVKYIQKQDKPDELGFKSN